MTTEDKTYAEKDAPVAASHSGLDHEAGVIEDVTAKENHALKRGLKGRHMQMIAIGGSIGAGLFVGSGGALSTGGPASLIIGFLIVGGMLLCTVQSLGELAVMYPVNGAFFDYSLRFLDKSWAFAMGYNYAVGWLVVLPYELTAAGLTIKYWRPDLNIGIWIAVFLTALFVIQVFGVKGYGEVEFILAMIKVTAILGFIILGIIIDCGGVPTDHRGYIGASYWHDPSKGGAFRNGFKGFCSVFVTAAFSFGGTEMVGLAAAETADPRRTIPRATKQTFWRICLFYIISLLLMGLIVPSNSPELLNSGDSDTKDSAFVLAIKLAGIKGLPSVMNVVITISVLSVANSCTYGSTRTFQALARKGMAPAIFARVDKQGRPWAAVILQLAFGLLAFVNESSVAGGQFFTWLLALTGLSYFFTWGSVCLSFIRYRAGWKAQGRSLSEIPWRSQLGLPGAWIGFLLNCLCLIATFYVSLFPVGSSPNAEGFFEDYLAAPIVIACYIFWKIYDRDWSLFIRTRDMDLDTGRREIDLEPLPEEDYTGTKGKFRAVYRFFC
ncbi:AAT family amino acid transporter [Xylona heveae TC161]|uniref:AAT family amino acid transporter n=1 Tax=Xylona heveae (strain CBS 132557 / TC161) TaxID=1328760 RepID=A0A165JZF7_XYLHT|nr:AAT family amino acid transporter [Xylona heveae TC161]KZF26821.1 AAT family amino acid transporter [Xylona heveae TC161]